MAFDDEPGASIFMSVFIKISLIPIGAEQNVRPPGWRSAHLLADCIRVSILVAFDDCILRVNRSSFTDK